MSIEDKIANAKHTTWVTDGIPKWQVRLIVWIAKFKSRKGRCRI
jgi:hypothetical protein